MDELHEKQKIEDFKYLYSILRSSEDLITDYYLRNQSESYFIEQFFHQILDLQYDFTRIVKNQIINGRIFSSNIYNYLFEYYLKDNNDVLEYDLVRALIEQKIENKLPYTNCLEAEQLAKYYVDSLYDEIFNNNDFDIYDRNKEFLLDFCSKTKMSENDKSYIYSQFNKIENRIVDNGIEQALDLQNSGLYTCVEDFESILENIEKYRCAENNTYVLKLKNYVFERKYDELKTEYDDYFNEDKEE